MTALRRGRWALSFADLCLLLLGFFVLLNASGNSAEEAALQLSRYFGPVKDDSAFQSIPASRLFQRGEAMLTPAGRAQLHRIGAEAHRKQRLVRIASVGEDKAGRRFDRWELAAARLAAAARALQEAGLPETHIELRGLDEAQRGGTTSVAGQQLVIWQKHRPLSRD
ncbi:MAG TPA: flagellar motor protein MotB [Rhizorhapis sp.]|nr:flagellar motor protein MotB [Rhizorhapis sp.]